MLSSLLLALREGLEAAIIIGILIGVLKKMELNHLRGVIWAGVVTAVAASLLTAWIILRIGAEFEGAGEQIFEGVMMFSAVILLTWMIFWMRSRSAAMRRRLEENVRVSVTRKSRLALFLTAFTAVLREGVELALFLLAVRFATTPIETLLGTLLGLAGAIALGWLIITSTNRLNLGKFFQITNVLLLVFAAGLVAHGVHEFNEAGVIPSVIEHVYNINSVLPEKSALGQILTTLIGYNGNPSLTELILYLAYAIGLGLAVFPWRRVSAPQVQSGD